jgi:hypothetical protein
MLTASPLLVSLDRVRQTRPRTYGTSCCTARPELLSAVAGGSEPGEAATGAVSVTAPDTRASHALVEGNRLHFGQAGLIAGAGVAEADQAAVLLGYPGAPIGFSVHEAARAPLRAPSDRCWQAVEQRIRELAAIGPLPGRDVEPSHCLRVADRGVADAQQRG